MANRNSVILLEQAIAARLEAIAPEMTLAQFLPFFAAEQALKDQGLTAKELEAGIVDGEHDCGIDALFVLLNGVLLHDEHEVERIASSAGESQLHLIILQAKSSGGFQEVPLDKLTMRLPEILDLERDPETLSSHVNPEVLEISARFLSAMRFLQRYKPAVTVSVYYAASKATEIHPSLKAAHDRLVNALAGVLPAAEITINFADAEWLLEQSHRKQQETIVLPTRDYLSGDERGGWACLVKIADLYQLLVGGDGRLKSTLFDANVRDYEGDVEVNAAIRSTLRQQPQGDFWWLNNGVTIIATAVRPEHRSLVLDDPQIVNGLQTSHEIFRHFTSADSAGDHRSILVKVILATDTSVRDNIIKATNYQTALTSSAVRATDRVQRDIEDYLLSVGLFYERRRNQYRNAEKRLDRIVTMEEMAQAVASALAQTPTRARGAVSELFNEENYPLLFNPSYPVEMYGGCLLLSRRIDGLLPSATPPGTLDIDWKFAIIMLAAGMLTRKENPQPKDLAAMDALLLTPNDIHRLQAQVADVYNRTSARTGHKQMRLLSEHQMSTGLLAEYLTSMLRSSDWHNFPRSSPTSH